MLYDSGYFNALNFILGCHPGLNTQSFASGVGAESATVGYGLNRAVVQRGKIHPEMPFPLCRDTSLLRHSFFLVLVNICLPSLTRTPSPSDKLVPEPRRKENSRKPCVVAGMLKILGNVSIIH